MLSQVDISQPASSEPRQSRYWPSCRASTTCPQRPDVIRLILSELGAEPGPGDPPVSLDRGLRDSERRGDLR